MKDGIYLRIWWPEVGTVKRRIVLVKGTRVLDFRKASWLSLSYWSGLNGEWVYLRTSKSSDAAHD